MVIEQVGEQKHLPFPQPTTEEVSQTSHPKSPYSSSQVISEEPLAATVAAKAIVDARPEPSFPPSPAAATAAAQTPPTAPTPLSSTSTSHRRKLMVPRKTFFTSELSLYPSPPCHDGPLPLPVVEHLPHVVPAWPDHHSNEDFGWSPELLPVKEQIAAMTYEELLRFAGSAGVEKTRD